MAGQGLGNLTYRGHGVEALGRKAKHGIDDIEQGQENADERGILQQPAAVEGHAAHILISLFLLEDLGHGGLGKRGGHTEKGGDPHPEQGPGATDGDGTGHAQYIARAHPHGRGQEKGSQGRDSFISFLAGSQNMDTISKMGNLDKTQPPGKIDSRTNQQNDGQGKISQDGNAAVPAKISGEIPEQVRYHLDPGTDFVNYIKQGLHKSSPSLLYYLH